MVERTASYGALLAGAVAAGGFDAATAPHERSQVPGDQQVRPTSRPPNRRGSARPGRGQRIAGSVTRKPCTYRKTLPSSLRGVLCLPRTGRAPRRSRPGWWASTARSGTSCAEDQVARRDVARRSARRADFAASSATGPPTTVPVPSGTDSTTEFADLVAILDQPTHPPSLQSIAVRRHQIAESSRERPALTRPLKRRRRRQ